MGIYKEIKKLYSRNINITRILLGKDDYKSLKKVDHSEAICLSYDIQAGTYVDWNNKNLKLQEEFCNFIFDKIINYKLLDSIQASNKNVKICDFGTGEATNYSILLKLLSEKYQFINSYGMDISLSRLDVARNFISNSFKKNIPKFFIGDLINIPIIDNSVDISITMHSIEPNGGREKEILNELIRVTSLKGYLIIAEPIYENASKEQKSRMKQHNYITNLKTLIKKNDNIEIVYEGLMPIENPLNRATLFILKKKKSDLEDNLEDEIYSCPLENKKLFKIKGSWISTEGSCYPEINGFPILRKSFAQPYFSALKYM